MDQPTFRIRLAEPVISEAEQLAVRDALASGRLAQGPRVAEFEEAFAAYTGTRHAVAVNSGTAALHLALLTHGVGSMGGGRKEDEVIVPAFSFAATANVVLQAGATPVFVDVRTSDFNVDPERCEAALSASTRALIGVHLYGQMCDAGSLRDLCNGRQIAFIEDAAQAVGASLDGLAAGSFGTGCFSFYATKNLTTGEGGMLTTNDAAIASRARMLRSQGEHERYVTEEVGWNYRLTEPAAALGSIQLLTLDERNSQRRANALKLSEMLAGLVDIVTPQETPTKGHAWHQYVIRILAGRDVRDALQVALRAHGIESAAFYPRAIHKQPLYARLGHGESNAPIAERLSGEVLALPVHPGLTPTDLGAIADAVRAFFAESANDTTTDRR